MKKYLAIVMAFFIILIAITGCGSKFENNTSASTNTPGAVNNTEPAKENWKSMLYFSDKDAMYLIGEEREMVSDKKLDTSEKAVILIRELIKGSSNIELSTSIPKTTKVNGVSIENGTAIVDVSKEFVQDNVGGSEGETMAIAPIVLTLTRLEGVQKVSFKIDGKVQSEFKGHYDLNLSFTRSEFEKYISK